MTQIQRIGGIWRAVGRALPEKSKANHHLGPRCDRCHQPKPSLCEVEVEPKTVWGQRTRKVCIPCMAKLRREARDRKAATTSTRKRRAA